jgi:hypothetical protein
VSLKIRFREDVIKKRKKLMFQHIFKNPFSFITFFVIAFANLLVHFIGNKTQLTGLTFLVYLVIFLSGIEFTRRTLLLWFPDVIAGLTLLALAFGTNLFCMVSLDYRLQPILLFSLFAMVVFFTASWHEHQKLIYAISFTIAMGLIILFQPTGYFVLLIPVLWGVHDKASWKTKILLIKNNNRQTDFFISCVAVLVLSPVLFWNISPGEIPFLSFQLPGKFYSFSSFFCDDLFSFDHGWLIYTPLMIFAFIGFYFFAEKNRSIFYPVFLFCILDLFLETSWSQLGTTPVFGQVAFIPAYALFVFPMASFIELIQNGKPVSRIILYAFTAIFILMNVFQTWQFNEGIILHSGMTADNYGQVFGRTTLTEIEKQQMTGIEQDTTFVLTDQTRFRKVDFAFYDFEDPNVPYKDKLERDHVKSGKMALTMDSTMRFSPAVSIRYDDFLKKPKVGMRITASVFATNSVALSGGFLVISSMHERTNYRYKKLNLGDLKLKPGVWNTVSLDYLIPTDPPPGDQLVSYIWYTGNSMIYIDDLKYEAFEPKK